MECLDVQDVKQVEIAQLMTPPHANPAGNVHGGTIMKIIDEAAFIVASRHTRKNCVTASVDRISFLTPVYIGDVVFAMAEINYVGGKSMEIGVRVESESLKTGKRRQVASAYLTFVALDEDNQPVSIKKIEPVTDEEIRRYEEAKARYLRRKNLQK